MFLQSSWIGSIMVALTLIGFGWNSDQTEQEAKEQKLLASLHGKWKFIDSDVEDVMRDAVITISEGEQTELARPQDSSLPSKAKEMASKFTLERTVHDVEKKLVRIRVEYVWDRPETGGAGLRKGLCRIDGKGNLEIIEAASAADDFPSDFSDDSKSLGKYRKFIRVKPSA